MSLIPEEINPEDKKRLEGGGENIIDTIDIGPYTAILVKSKGGMYQIGLTSHENTFTTATSQNKRPTKENMKTIITLWSKLTDKIKEWLQTYGEIYGGSMNQEKTRKYRIIFTRYGLNCGEIMRVPGGSLFAIYP